MFKSFPFNYNIYGHVEDAGIDKHIRDMMEQILFTIPGERVNRPDFGCGVQNMVFGSTLPEVMSVKQTGIQSQLQRYLGHLIKLQEVKVTTEESRVDILIRYIVYADQSEHTKVFTR
jgi:uncharacterized protein